MSITTHPVISNLNLSEFSYWCSTSYDEVQQILLSHFNYSTYEGLNFVDQNGFRVPYQRDSLYQTADSLHQELCFNYKQHEEENIPPIQQGNVSTQATNYIGQFHSNDKSKPKIWRPFSPSPYVNNVDSANVHQSARNDMSVKSRQLFKITPSSVKIEASKTSVFKAVKKRIYSCTQCSSRYLNNAQLNSHLRAHSGFKPYTCKHPNCTKSFARNEELTRHSRIHSGYKPHLCSICAKSFGRKDHLSKHLKTHLQMSEKKVHVCCIPGCGHRYTRSDALTRHKSTAHAMKTKIQSKKVA